MWTSASAWMRRAGVGPALLLLVFALATVAGCGGSARPDVDLNTGRSLDDGRPGLAAGFPDAADTTRAGAGDWLYRIQPGDELEIVFFTHPEQNRFVKVRPDGRISLPYLGDLIAAAQTPEQLARSIEAGYVDVLISPRVDVLVSEMGGRYYVLGEVRSPGEYSLESRVSILQGLARAGGYTPSARLTQLVLLRRTADGEHVAALLNLREYMDAAQRQGDARLQPYDILWVPKDAISRWDNFARKAFYGVVQAEEMVIKGWSLANFEAVFERNIVSP